MLETEIIETEPIEDIPTEDTTESVVEVVPIESYISIDDIKNSRVVAFNGLPDDFIQRKLNDLSRVIDEYCNTKFIPTIEEWKTDLKSRVKALKTPLLSVEEVKVLEDILIEDEHYYVYPEKNLIEIENTMSYERKKKVLNIKYTYGFKEVPAIVKEVLLELFKDSVETLTQTTGRVKSEQWEDYSYTLSDNSEVVQGILSRLDIFKQEEEVERHSNKIRAMLL